MENALCVLKKNMYSAALDGLVCICLLLGSIGLKYSSNIGSMFPYWFSIWMIHSFFKVRCWSPLVLFYIVFTLFSSVSICFIYLASLMLGLYIDNMMVNSSSLWITFIIKELLCLWWFIEISTFYLLFISTSAMFLVIIYMEFFFASLHNQPIFIPKTKISLLYELYILMLFAYPFRHCMSLIGKSNPFLFKVIIYRWRLSMAIFFF